MNSQQRFNGTAVTVFGAQRLAAPNICVVCTRLLEVMLYKGFASVQKLFALVNRGR